MQSTHLNRFFVFFERFFKLFLMSAGIAYRLVVYVCNSISLPSGRACYLEKASTTVCEVRENQIEFYDRRRLQRWRRQGHDKRGCKLCCAEM